MSNDKETETETFVLYEKNPDGSIVKIWGIARTMLELLELLEKAKKHNG